MTQLLVSTEHTLVYGRTDSRHRAYRWADAHGTPRLPFEVNSSSKGTKSRCVSAWAQVQHYFEQQGVV